MDRTQIWNCGGGTQSAAIAVLIIQSKLPPPDLAVIADTGRERADTWAYMDDWIAPALADVGVTVHRVKKQKYATVDLQSTKGDTLLMPFYTDRDGGIGKLTNFCSHEWKTRVVQRWATREHNVNLARNWLGFSIDEIGRAAKLSRKTAGKWIARFPLLEQRMTRGDCIALVERHGWPTPPRSSCWMCPNHHMNEWREIRAHPDDWHRVVLFDRYIRTIDPNVWLTSECKPIDECNFDDDNEVLFGRDRGGCDSGQCFV